jgi:medium-chain acyl-[acyl-carrier-protein] hydrolase
MDALVRPLADAIVPHLTSSDLPFAIFGHSMGALVSFELARALRRLRAPSPVQLFLSARRAPHVPDRHAPLYDLPDSDLVAGLSRRYNGMPRAVLESADLMRMFLPIVRADLTMIETYAYVPDVPLACPISAFGGLEDGAVTRDDLAAWGDHTSGSFTLRMVAGGHFFLQSDRPRLLAALSADLHQTLAGPG